ncbi:hypothetical protein XH99_28905 [Bradyrhizobium nanningense]|uniref:RiboL-PSP-HEPN domain-containing protein n=1 Tax=Bradyrhizobium nanningense TaxID=1325118 RepID=A0A4Q0RXF4_9BRAD|nr:hypothetical protein [Bradyrhizobium nanningense]RXH24111.1 hypothetical protein XH99_28905 [Bradyrhizobium nanningense]RXH29334.1 hypothetical protein XH84_22895 [Bradyrhizobium nanningense]
MEVFCIGTARIRHSQTGEIYEIGSDDLDWDMVGGDEQSMGPEFRYEASVEHADLGTLTWSLWEYPVGIQNARETDVGQHELLHDFDYGLEHGPPEPDEWLDSAPPYDPFWVFLESYRGTIGLLASQGAEDGRFLVNRLVFSHQVTALETYLGDTLINEVFSDAKVLERLLDGDRDLSKEKFTLPEIAKDPGLINRKVREYLKSILYHNLQKVDVLYHLALGVRILDLAKNKSALLDAVRLRHDCVHRNGRDKEGRELDVFTKGFVQDTANTIKELVEKIEEAIRAR